MYVLMRQWGQLPQFIDGSPSVKSGQPASVARSCGVTEGRGERCSPQTAHRQLR